MIYRGRWLASFSFVGLALLAGACSRGASSTPRLSAREDQLPPDQRDAEILGREIFQLVDQAVDYRGSHRGRPAASFVQMGIESLTPATVRRIVHVQREPVVTVAYRRTAGREITSCRGDSHILEEASLNGGRFTLMCTAGSGDQRPMEVGKLPDR